MSYPRGLCSASVLFNLEMRGCFCWADLSCVCLSKEHTSVLSSHFYCLGRFIAITGSAVSYPSRFFVPNSKGNKKKPPMEWLQSCWDETWCSKAAHESADLLGSACSGSVTSALCLSKPRRELSVSSPGETSTASKASHCRRGRLGLCFQRLTSIIQRKAPERELEVPSCLGDTVL